MINLIRNKFNCYNFIQVMMKIDYRNAKYNKKVLQRKKKSLKLKINYKQSITNK